MVKPLKALGGAVIALALVVGASPSPAAAQTAALEYRVKAAFLYKFVPFIDWPAAAFQTPTSPVVLCVAGRDPFGAMLDQTVAGQSVDARPIVVRRLTKAEPTAGCHILYIGGSQAQSAADAIASVRGAPVLTVTDQAADGPARGAIHFVVRDNRVRFHIDTASAAQNGLKMSSKLLSLALSAR